MPSTTIVKCSTKRWLQPIHQDNTTWSYRRGNCGSRPACVRLLGFEHQRLGQWTSELVGRMSAGSTSLNELRIEEGHGAFLPDSGMTAQLYMVKNLSPKSPSPGTI